MEYKESESSKNARICMTMEMTGKSGQMNFKIKKIQKDEAIHEQKEMKNN